MGTSVAASIELVDGSGETRRAEVQGKCTWDGGHPTCELALTSGDVSVRASASDYFDAFCLIREELEKIGLMPVCYGASRYVWPSGMCRDMGLGLKAYNRGIGERQSPPDLVGLFETGPDVAPVSVPEQRAYAQAALAAFKR